MNDEQNYSYLKNKVLNFLWLVVNLIYLLLNKKTLCNLNYILGVGGPREKGKLREITKAELKRHGTKKVSF